MRLYDLLECYLDPEGVAQLVALEQCGPDTAYWLDTYTGGSITEDTPERVLIAVAGCLAELSVLVLHGGGCLEELSPRTLSAMEDLAEERLGRYGLL